MTAGCQSPHDDDKPVNAPMVGIGRHGRLKIDCFGVPVRVRVGVRGSWISARYRADLNPSGSLPDWLFRRVDLWRCQARPLSDAYSDIQTGSIPVYGAYGCRNESC